MYAKALEANKLESLTVSRTCTCKISVGKCGHSIVRSLAIRLCSLSAAFVRPSDRIARLGDICCGAIGGYGLLPI